MNERKRIEQQAKDDAENSMGGASPAAAIPDEDDDNPEFTEEDFEEALRKVSRRDKSDDKGKGDDKEK